jgi:hypothetical protein
MSNKKLVVIFTIIAAIFIGCSEQTSVVDPIQDDSDSWLKMPAKGSLAVETIYLVEKEIVGSSGGVVQLQVQYPGGPFGDVKINAEITFPPGAFQGTKNIGMVFDDEYVLTSFSPSANFDLPATFNLTVEGLNLDGVDVSELKFVYDNPAGEDVEMASSGIEINYGSGLLKVNNAVIPHFCKFGVKRGTSD